MTVEVNQIVAGTNNLTAGQVSSLAVSGLQPNVNTAAAATANVAAIQARLDSSGDARIIDAGIIWVNSPIYMKDNTSIYVGANTIIKMLAGVQNVFVETYASAYFSDRSVTGITSVGTLATVNITAHGRAVNDWVCIGGSTSGGYNGTFQVESVTDANNYTVRLLLTPTVTTAVGTIVERTATYNIAITGPGWWDNNRANRSALGSKRDMCFMLTYCANVTIDIRARNAIHRVIGPGYTNGLRGPGLIYENSIGGLINGGPVSNYDIDLVQGNSSVDDIFALQGSDYAAYAIGGPGDCLRCKVGTIRGLVTSIGNAIKITGATGFTQELEVGTVEAECQVSDLVQVVTDAAVVSAGTNCRLLKIGLLRHINPVNNSAGVRVARDSGTTVIESLILNSVDVKVPAGVTYDLIGPNNTNCSITRAKVSNFHIEGATAAQAILLVKQVGDVTTLELHNGTMLNCQSIYSHDSAGSASGQNVYINNVNQDACSSGIAFRRAINVYSNGWTMGTTMGTAAFSGSVGVVTLYGDMPTQTYAGNPKLFNFTAGAGNLFRHISGDVTCTYTALSAAQMLALNATPVTLVPAPGASLGLEFISASVFMDYGTAAYAGIAAGEDLAIRYTNGSGAIVGAVEATGFLDQTADQLRVVYPSSAVATTQAESTPVLNAALVAHMTTGEITTGDSLLYFKTYTRTRNTLRTFG